MTLPAFLLAQADSRWVWLGFKNIAVPPPNVRWTLRRTLALTALNAGFGAGLGLLLALAIWHQPVGWLPWLLGLFLGCSGLCWHGVTAICWNQRAARLRAAPAFSTVLPKTRFQIFRWLLGFVYFVVLAVITPLAMMITVENIRGEIAWKREHATLIAQGEKLTFREILGPEIPAAQNAGAAHIFAPFFDYHRDRSVVRHDEITDSDSSSTVWPSSNALARVENALRPPDQRHFPESPKQDKLRTPAVNLEDWSAAYRSMVAKPTQDDPTWGKDLKLPEPGDPARDVLTGLAIAEPVLAEISAASALPRAQFPIHYDEAFDALLRHLSQMKGVQLAFRLRCAAHLASGDTNAAFADATNALNAAELFREEPLLISQLVRNAQGTIAVSTLWQGMAEHRWTDAQLAVFQERLSRINYLQGLVLAFEGERAGGILSMERLIATPPSGMYFGDDAALARLLKTIPRGMLRQNQVAIAQYQTAYLAVQRGGLTNMLQDGFVALLDSGDRQNENLSAMLVRPYSPYRVLAAMLVPALGKASSKAARAQTTVKMAIVACVLERYRLAHGSFPDTLEGLAPQFIAEVPLDPMVNRPFHYQRTGDGWFRLYSIGTDGKDDGGVFKLEGNKPEKDWPWPVPTRPEKFLLF